MKKDRVAKVKTEIKRLMSAINELDEANKDQDERYGNSANYYDYHPRESGAVRRASMDLTRALAEMRRSDYDNR